MSDGASVLRVSQIVADAKWVACEIGVVVRVPESISEDRAVYFQKLVRLPAVPAPGTLIFLAEREAADETLPCPGLRVRSVTMRESDDALQVDTEERSYIPSDDLMTTDNSIMCRSILGWVDKGGMSAGRFGARLIRHCRAREAARRRKRAK